MVECTGCRRKLAAHLTRCLYCGGEVKPPLGAHVTRVGEVDDDEPAGSPSTAWHRVIREQALVIVATLVVLAAIIAYLSY